jgi:sirohydrochlorin cobaltochelatase
MRDSVERFLAVELRDRCCFGEILIRKTNDGFVLCHHGDANRGDLKKFSRSEDAIQIARYDDAGNYRSLKTAPNFRHGWELKVADVCELRRALDYFYPGRLATFIAWKQDRLRVTSLRETLNRQSGMYRVAAKISDEEIDQVVGSLCRSDGGCLRKILWKRDSSGINPSNKLPAEKFDPAQSDGIPLLCQEACNLLVNECRKIVKGE